MMCLVVSPMWSQTTRLLISSDDPTTVDSAKVYDGNTIAHVNHVGALIGVEATHPNVALNAIANYISPNVDGINRIVVTYTLSGSDSSYYLPPFNDTLPGGITAKSLTVAGTTIDTAKVYNRGVLLNISSPGTLYGAIDGDDVHLSAIARFADPNVGVDKEVAVTYSLYGSSASNYVVPAGFTHVADILPVVITAPVATVATGKEYDGNITCPVIDQGTIEGVLVGDSVTHLVTASFTNPNVGMMKRVNLYYFLQGPQSNNYTISVPDTAGAGSAFSSIYGRTIEAEGYVIKREKTYDGTDVAEVLVPATATNLVGNDNVTLITTARFDSPEVGTNKQIIVHFDIEGEDAGNYLAPADEIYGISGAIIPATIIDTTVGERGIVSTTSKYCQGDEANLGVHITQGTPTFYTLRFSEEALAQGFADVTVPVTIEAGQTSVNVAFDIPLACKEGKYSVVITLGNRLYSTISTTWHFSVNMSNSYLVAAFDDVVSIDNRENRFNTFQWYRNNEAIEGATKPYYQDPRGYLEGAYSLLVNKGTDDEHYICPLNFYTSDVKKTVSANPNPVINTTKVKVTGFESEQHLLTIFNSYGAILLRTTFNGEEYDIDMTTMPHGTYMINVDGLTTKTVKL